jgi:CRP-like cAMP-binding protein
MKSLLHYLTTIYPLSEELLLYLSSILKPKTLSKKEFLLKAGHVCREIYFIEKGLLRCFYIKDALEISSWFMREGDVAISVDSFFQQKESYEAIQALEDCSLYYITYNELQYIYREFPEFNFVGRILTEKYYALSEQRLYSLRMQRAADRYRYLLQSNPDIILRVHSKFIASYLGLEESTLSKIKNKI